ncbi:ABC transporter substrate-binding protein [Actinomadura roseirufa]|uniref:ABC transporter substrate-binding protein n=1 Tax=Actinomadura roseirufa TaxID=2094049 RepID=UPI0013F17B6C|nr:ABC transporter substrate-binding protein [Actinomadura roseirufa]
MTRIRLARHGGGARTGARTRLTVLAASAVLLAGMAAGCGGGKDDGDAAGGPAVSPAAPGTPATGTPIKLGVLLTGPSLPDSPGRVLQAWQADVNSHGGVAGHPVTFEFVETNGDAPTATAKIAPVLRQKDLAGFVVLEPITEAVVADAITKAGVPVIGGEGYTPTAWGKMPNWISLSTSFPAVAAGVITMAKQNGAKKPAIVVCSEIPNCALVGQLTEGTAKTLGLTYGGTLTASATAPDYTAQCLKLISDGVDYVIPSMNTVAADMKLIADCQRQGYTGQWGMFDGSVQPREFKANDPGVPINLGLTNPPWFTDDPAVRRFRDMMRRQGVKDADWAFPRAMATYTTLTLFKKTIEARSPAPSARVSRADIIAAYGAVKNERLDGLLAQPLSFTADKPSGPVNCFWTAKYENGKFTDGGLNKTVCHGG